MRHQCPVCAAPVQARDLRPNPSYDRLLASMMSLREEATAKRTTELFNGSPAQSPIEALCVLHSIFASLLVTHGQVKATFGPC